MGEPSQWRNLLEASARQHKAGRVCRNESARLLWLGARAAMQQWRTEVDPTGVRLYRDVLAALGGTRKGSASKIKTVALATVAYGLDIDAYGSLNAAYQAAHRMGLGLVADPEPVCTCVCSAHAK